MIAPRRDRLGPGLASVLAGLLLAGSSGMALAEAGDPGSPRGEPPAELAVAPSSEPSAPVEVPDGYVDVGRLLTHTAALIRSGRLDRAEADLETALETGRVAASLLRRLQDRSWPLSLDELSRLEASLPARPAGARLQEDGLARPAQRSTTDESPEKPSRESGATAAPPASAAAPACPEPAALPLPPVAPSPDKTETRVERPQLPDETPGHAQLIARARGLMELDDISGARLMLERAVQGGSPRAILLLGETYDPRLNRKRVPSASNGDLARAMSLYRTASELGVPGAEAHLRGIGAQASFTPAP